MQYSEIYQSAVELLNQAKCQPDIDFKTAKQILGDRTSSGLSLEGITKLLLAIKHSPKKSEIKEAVISASKILRRKLFGDKVFLMAPIEISNVCLSDCKFCSWKKSNKTMPRKRISQEAVIGQAEYLLDLGIRHIEFVGGDDFYMIKNDLPSLKNVLEIRHCVRFQYINRYFIDVKVHFLIIFVEMNLALWLFLPERQARWL